MENSNAMEMILDKLYNDPANPAGFAGLDQLWNEAKKEDSRIKRKDVKTYLEGHRTYTLHKPRRIHFKRSKTYPAGYMTDVQCDLADFQKLSRQNNGNNYALVAIDVLSKRVFAVPVRTKKSKDMINAFEKILERMEMYPHRIFSDKGKEFTSKEIMDFFKEKDIEKYTPNASIVKASLAERCIRNLKQRLYRFMSEKHTLKWTEALEKIVDAINHSKCRVLGGLRPIDISFNNAKKVREFVFGKVGSNQSKKKPRFKEKEYVRMSRNKNVFEKGYLPNYSYEILQVDLVKSKANPNRYRVRDNKGELFKGYFYPEELTRVRKDDNTSYRIENRNKIDGGKEYYVKFLDYPEPEWIDETHNVSDYPDNRPNKYRVHLPKPIEFQGGNWVCGLYSIQYPQSWAATIGTDEKQWVEINYKNQPIKRIGIPETTQLTPKGLGYFLKLALNKGNRVKRGLLVEKSDKIVVNEINMIATPAKKRKRREILEEPQNEEEVPEEIQKQRFIEKFFTKYLHNYWDMIRYLEDELVDQKVNIENTTKKLSDETDPIKKENYHELLEHLIAESEIKKKQIPTLKEEAKKRDGLDQRQVAEQFLETHQENYHEEFIELELDIIARYMDLDKKIKENQGVNQNVRATQDIKSLINVIKLMRKKLEELESVIIEKDFKSSREEFHQKNSKTHSEFVQKFFDDHPDDHLITFWRNLDGLKNLHKQIREKRSANLNEQDDVKKQENITDIEQKERLFKYRRERFNAIRQEAYRRYINNEFWVPPTNDEIKHMQKVEEKNHPEYLKHARKIDEDGNPIPIPPPILTEEMLEPLIKRGEYERNKEMEDEQKEKNLDLDSSKQNVIIPELFEDNNETDQKDEESSHILFEEHKQENDFHSDIEFEYLESIDRFRAHFNDPNIEDIKLSKQLCYVLGFPLRSIVNGQIGKYGIDLKGGFTSFAVYSKGLTDTVIMGNSVSSLLRIVAVDNKSGGVVERVYEQPMFIPVLPREINEIEIELRWMNGNLIKFNHGTVILTLVFKNFLKF
ncbi:Integrase catalytic domain-containing protein [Meloidogyne graminicola]|uniref:Integrase catalytic domain-containing protein n=1 Tax=Meloidogyne graminicola TaxID=189291 RepID=A0A8S9Z7E2_9BILA|nr:Integrase catalytic domain-containing protein [Meloidogyne graminicola]